MIYNNFEKRISIIDNIINENIKSIDAMSILCESFDIVLEGEKLDAFKEKAKEIIDKIIAKIKDVLKWIGEKIGNLFKSIKEKFSNIDLKKKLEDTKKNTVSNNNESTLMESVSQEELLSFLNSDSEFNKDDYRCLQNVNGSVRKIMISKDIDDLCKVLYVEPEEISSYEDCYNRCLKTILNNGKSDTTCLTYNEFIETASEFKKCNFEFYVKEFEESMKSHTKDLESAKQKLNSVASADSLQDLLKIGNSDNGNLKAYNSYVSTIVNIFRFFTKSVSDFRISFAKANTFLDRVNGAAA